jgi:PAS domain S-box-containing protein
MPKWLQRFLVPPVFPGDEEKTHIARLLNPILLMIMWILAVYALAAVLIFPELFYSAIVVIATLGVLLLARFWMVRGKVQLASIIFILGLGLDITLVVLFAGGMTSIDNVFFVTLLVFAGLLLGRRGTIWLTVAIFLIGLGMVVLDAAHAMPVRVFPVPARSGLVMLTSALIMVAATMNIALRSLNEARARSEKELAERKIIEAALVESENRFHTIFDSVNDAIFVHDVNTGAILDVNQRMCEMYGYTRREVLQLSIADMSQDQPPYTQREAMGWFRQIPAGGSRLAEWCAKDKNGRLFWVEVNLRHTVMDGQERMLVTVRDINERKKADQRRIALYRISDAARAAQGLEEFCQLIHAVIGTLMPAKNFFIALHDPVTGFISYPYYSDEYDQPPPPHQIEKGLTAYVLQNQEPLLATSEVFQELEARGEVENVGTPSIDWLGVPLKTKHGTLGVLAVQTYKEAERLTADDQDVLVFVSNQVAMMLERKQAEEHDHMFSQGLRAVIEAADELIRCDQLDILYRRAVELAREKIGVERVGLFLLDPEGKFLLGTYGTDSHGHTTEEHAAFEPADNHPYLFKPSDRLWEVRKVTQAFWEGEKPHLLQPGWVAGTVIRSLERPIGILFNDSAISQSTLNETLQETLAVYCSLLGNIIERKRLEEREQDTVSRLHAVVECADELIRTVDLDTLYRRAVELAREKLNVERCGIFILDETQEYMIGTYGTDNQGQTTDERTARWEAKRRPEIFAGGGQTRVIRQDDELTYWENGDRVDLGRGWVAFTLLHIADEPFGLFCNDTAISHSPPDEAVQETVTIYCSLLGNIIDRKRSEEHERDMANRLHAVVDAADELIGCESLDALYRRAVELARDKLGLERCSIFLLDEKHEQLTGTYGTNALHQTTDEHFIQIPADDIPEIIDRVVQKYTIHEDVIPVYYEGEIAHNLNPGWVCSTLIRIAEEPIGVFYNDNAITQAEPSETVQETVVIYSSLLGNIIKRMRVESEQKRLIKELEAKNSELERFAYTVSHDLKSPLITIRGFLGFLEKDAASGNLDRFRTDITRISEATNKMQQLLNGLLELSRVGRLMNPGQLVPFEEITRDAIALVYGQIDALGAELIVQEDLPTVFGDRARLVEVVQNLLDNAIKFSSPRVSPRIEIGTRGFDETGKPVFFVRDNGQGIDPQYHDRIFGLFNKLDAQSEGTGIGLALVKRIVEFHSGRIWVESGGPDPGSTFYFTLPITDPQEHSQTKIN